MKQSMHTEKVWNYNKMRKKRILWICNHVTLMDAEVPLLLDLGFEVFTPKKFPSNSDFISCKVNYSYDDSLTIPPEDLMLLNTVDFYADKFSPEVISAINRNFDIAITTFYEKPMHLLVNHFPGYIFVRAFGLAGSATYYDVARENWGQAFLDRMQQIKPRLFFAAAYYNMLKVERNIFRENGVFLPLGLPENFAMQLRDGYTGTRKQILFVCPRICTVPYYYNIYKEFKRDFNHFPHVIAGKPFGKVSDRHLLGYLPREEFNKVFCESRVMYYHSTEPRHLHYHPLEAMFANLPVVFRSQGMLGELTPKVKYPGAADSVAEAQKKIRRVLNNDQGLIRDIQDSQKELLEYFSDDYVKGFWVRNFLPLVEKPVPQTGVPADRREHVGIILPLGYRGGTLHAFVSIANMLQRIGYRVTAGIVDDYFKPGDLYYPTILDELREKLDDNIVLRTFSWQKLDNFELANFCLQARFTRPLNPQVEYALMDDHINKFFECDRWLFISDRFYAGSPLPCKPYSVLVYDYLQRYLPFQLLPEDLENCYLTAVRQADSVLVTNKATSEDVSAYAGVKQENIYRLPFEFNGDELEQYLAARSNQTVSRKKYIVWACNLGYHKNHVNVLKALIDYVRLCPDGPDVYITGVDTDKLNPGNRKKYPQVPGHVEDFRELFRKNKDLLRKRVHFKGEMERYDYLDLLSEAGFLFLSSIADNGAFGAVEAAYLGTPCACSDYPHMRFMAECFNLDVLFYKGSSINSIFETFKIMGSGSFNGRIPSCEDLRKMNYANQSEAVKQTLKEAWI